MYATPDIAGCIVRIACALSPEPCHALMRHAPGAWLPPPHRPQHCPHRCCRCRRAPLSHPPGACRCCRHRELRWRQPLLPLAAPTAAATLIPFAACGAERVLMTKCTAILPTPQAPSLIAMLQAGEGCGAHPSAHVTGPGEGWGGQHRCWIPSASVTTPHSSRVSRTTHVRARSSFPLPLPCLLLLPLPAR